MEWLEGSDADVVALQEVRARPDQVPDQLRHAEGWHLTVTPSERPGYSGVGLLSRRPPDAFSTTLGRRRFDREGRVQIARFGDLTLVNVYFPNGNGRNRDLSRIPYKIAFYRHLLRWLEPAREAGEAILVMGDFNTAHRPIDLARPKQNRETSGFRPEERRELERWLEHGWVDTFRRFQPAGGHYTWWSQRQGVRERNVGWRIDYVLASPGAWPRVRDATIHPGVMGSDHCPIAVEVESSGGPAGRSAFPRIG